MLNICKDSLRKQDYTVKNYKHKSNNTIWKNFINVVTLKKQVIMTHLKQILYLSAIGLLFASCASYGVISDNDVYLQKPAAIDLTDDQEDITSFNAYKAGRQGAFQNGDPRLRNTNARAFATYNTRFMFGTYYNPFHSYYPTDPFIWGRPYYYFYGLNSPMYGMNTYFAPGFGHNYGGYGYLSPYYSHNYYGVNYIGPNSNYSWYNTSGNSSFFGSSSNNQFYGHRTPLSGNSRRSSAHPQTLESKMHNNVKPSKSSYYSKNHSPKNIQNRRTVSNSEREYVRPNINANRGTTTNYSGSNRNVNVSSANQRRTSPSASSYRNRSYSPSNTARRSGTVNRSNVDRRTSGTYNSSNNARRGTYSKDNSNNRGSSYSSPQRSSGSSINRSGGSSTRSSGSSSNRGSSSSSGRR